MQTEIKKLINEADYNILLRSALNYGYGVNDFILETLSQNDDGFKIIRKKDELWFIAENRYDGIEEKEIGMISCVPSLDGIHTFETFRSGYDFLKQFQEWIQKFSMLEKQKKF